ncbi:MAG: hypothetical protein ISS69_14310 [Phycisphaerae bacterium]|nr:hypothetical protein [Phycisphaerae bacterium]
MINNRLVIAAVLTAFCAGCSDEYNHERLDTDGPEARQVRSFVSVLRQGGTGGLDKTMPLQALGGLTEDQLKALRSTLKRIVTADSVELQKIEQFGDQVYRVVFALETDGTPESLAMLLGMTDDDTLGWIGKN